MPHIVLAGCGHAHLSLITHCEALAARDIQVTCISPKPHHYYSGMGPGMLGGIYRTEQIRFDVKTMAESRSARFMVDTVTRIRPHEKSVELASGNEVAFDVLSCSLGSGVPGPFAEDPENDVFTVKPIVNLLQTRQRLHTLSQNRREVRIGVIGGGGAGVEAAGNAYRCVRQSGGVARVVLYAGRRLMPSYPGLARKLVLRSLEERDIEVLEGERVEELHGRTVTMPSGREDTYDLIIIATGVKPSDVFAASGLPTGEDGGLLINENLQSVAHPDIFGGGDCIAYQPQPLAKVGVYAVRENPVLLHNVPAQAKGESLQSFDPGRGYMLIFNLGDSTGVLVRGKIALRHSLAFKLKDWIDRRFMRKFGNPEA